MDTWGRVSLLQASTLDVAVAPQRRMELIFVIRKMLSRLKQSIHTWKRRTAFLEIAIQTAADFMTIAHAAIQRGRACLFLARLIRRFHLILVRNPALVCNPLQFAQVPHHGQ